MEILRDDHRGIQRALEVLRSGGVVAHATETCYGLACDLRNPEIVLQLFRIKNRPLEQPVSALFSSIEEAKKYVEWNDEAQKLAEKFLPGPLTLILSLKKHAGLFPRPNPNPNPNPNPHTLGLRISSHPITQQLVSGFGSPLSTTSANLHGRPNAYSPQDIIDQFSTGDLQPDLILDSGQLPSTPPSTVIDLSGGNNATRRQGAVNI